MQKFLQNHRGKGDFSMQKLTRGFKLVTRIFELVTRKVELVPREFNPGNLNS